MTHETNHTPEAIAAIKARLAAATDGPWENMSYGDTPVWILGRDEAGMHGTTDVLKMTYNASSEIETTEIRDADADLIANAPADLAYLLAENARYVDMLAGSHSREIAHLNRALDAERENARLQGVIEAVNARLDQTSHPYSDHRIPVTAERELLRELYDAEFVDDLERILTTSPQPTTETAILDLMSKTPIDPALLERVRNHVGGDLPLGHHFIGVTGHPDDDECTFRNDGTDLTYCGEAEAEHDLPTETDEQIGESRG